MGKCIGTLQNLESLELYLGTNYIKDIAMQAIGENFGKLIGLKSLVLEIGKDNEFGIDGI